LVFKGFDFGDELKNYKTLPHVSLGDFPLRYCVASTPRSGTRYAAALLSKSGLCCGHEQYFCVDKIILQSCLPYFGDSSWLSVPFLHLLPDDAILFHQVRNPIKTIQSCVGPNNKGRFYDYSKDRRPESPWFAFHHDHTIDWEWPDTSDPIAMENHFWCEWHERIEEEGRKHRYIRYRVEDMDENVVRVMFSILGQRSSYDRQKVRDALGMVSKKTNHRGDRGKADASIITPRTRKLAEKYGYEF